MFGEIISSSTGAGIVPTLVTMMTPVYPVLEAFAFFKISIWVLIPIRVDSSLFVLNNILASGESQYVVGAE